MLNVLEADDMMTDRAGFVPGQHTERKYSDLEGDIDVENGNGSSKARDGERRRDTCHDPIHVDDILASGPFRVLRRHRELAAGGFIVEVELRNLPGSPPLMAIVNEFGQTMVPMAMRCNQRSMVIIQTIMETKRITTSMSTMRLEDTSHSHSPST